MAISEAVVYLNDKVPRSARCELNASSRFVKIVLHKPPMMI